MEPSDKDVLAALSEVIGGEVVPRAELGDRLSKAGYRFGKTKIESQIQHDTRFFEMGDGVGYLPALTEGLAFSVWIDPETAAENYFLKYPALDVIGWWLVECPVDVFDESGDRIGAIESDGWLIDDVDTDVVVGPDGWLEQFADSWVAFRVRQETLVIERLAGPPPVKPERAAAVRAAFDSVAEHQQYLPVGSDEPVDVMRIEVSTVLKAAIRSDVSLFAGEPLPPSADLLAAGGLRFEWPWVVPADLDPEIFAAAETERRSMLRWGVDADDALAAQLLLGAIKLHGAGSPVAFGATPEEREMSPALFEALLERKPVAMIVASECSDVETCDAARGFAESIAAVFEDDPSSWAMGWLVAHCHLVRGDVDDAVALLDGLPSGLDHLPVLIDQARVAIERSQAKDAQRLLRSAERLADDLPEMALLSFGYRRLIGQLQEGIDFWASTVPSATARRNERCPCGSGRKYKVCHLGRELHPIEVRAAWLYQKMARYVRELEHEEIDSLAWVMTDAMDSPQSWTSMVDMPFIPDLVLHEEQAEQGFVDGRLSTLPDDEVLLAQQWMFADRSVFEVESVGPGALFLRDLSTGDAVEVSNLGDGPTSVPGMILLGRPLPVGDSYRAYSGFMALRPDLLPDALSALDSKDPDALVELLGSMLRAPKVQNTDGQNMQPTSITWSLPDGLDVTDALVRAGLTDDGGVWTLVRDTTNQKNAMVATLQVLGDTMEGSVNSAERAGELMELIADHLPDAVHLGTDVVDVDDVDVAELPDQSEMMADPEVRAAVEAHMQRYETEWLDSPIPALGGRTPRDAAADPIAREELIRLLATFPELGQGGVGMSSERLRVALGL
jgi:hypothetical protein